MLHIFIFLLWSFLPFREDKILDFFYVSRYFVYFCYFLLEKFEKFHKQWKNISKNIATKFHMPEKSWMYIFYAMGTKNKGLKIQKCPLKKIKTIQRIILYFFSFFGLYSPSERKWKKSNSSYSFDTSRVDSVIQHITYTMLECGIWVIHKNIQIKKKMKNFIHLFRRCMHIMH